MSARSILVALDLSPESRAAAELAVEVAAALGEAIEGLFVEDLELLELAGHPLAREVDLYGAGARPLDRGRMERSLRAQAVRARALLASIAGPRGVAWTFRAVRGAVLEEIRTAARQSNAVTLGRVGWSRGLGRALGRTTQELLIEGAPRVLLPGRLPARKGPVVAGYDGSPASVRVLDAAARLARASGTLLRVEVVAPDERKLGALEAEARTHLEGTEARFHTHAISRPADPVALLGQHPCACLVMPASALGGGRDLIAFVADLDCPLLLVR